MQTVLQLPRRYDPERLRADLDRAIAAGAVHYNRADYHDGGWSAIALYGLDGSTEADALRWAGWDANYDKTPILRECPYFEEIVDGFECRKARVRILRLEPGTNINEHRDDGDGWAIGKVRLHIPIITHSEVYFYVDGQRVIMEPGTLWYCDFTRPHRVHNKSEITRVHIVLDLMVDDWLRGLFPPEPLTHRVRNVAQRAGYRAKVMRYALPEMLGLSKLKQRLGR